MDRLHVMGCLNLPINLQSNFVEKSVVLHLPAPVLLTGGGQLDAFFFSSLLLSEGDDRTGQRRGRGDVRSGGDWSGEVQLLTENLTPVGRDKDRQQDQHTQAQTSSRLR